MCWNEGNNLEEYYSAETNEAGSRGESIDVDHIQLLTQLLLFGPMMNLASCTVVGMGMQLNIGYGLYGVTDVGV